MEDEEFNYLKTLLKELSTMDVISLHSFLRNDELPDVVRIADIIEKDSKVDEEIIVSATKLLALVEVEFQNRNLN
jgi:hypothetical protein